ncbi:multicopper oxidase domain-containing protein, partial [Agrobacterium vitis]|uniref:multicopper oxidase domain-containing protein n=1 Tax=Agrobacterium vitis TaxID=373 RepID=UPI003B51B170
MLLSINPGMKFEYEYNIPVDHPAGTFWYHPHRHGSTALQVGSGMAGALIIPGDRPPADKTKGGPPPFGQPVPGRPLGFQKNPHARPSEGGKAEPTPGPGPQQPAKGKYADGRACKQD